MKKIKNKLTIEQEINEFFKIWGRQTLVRFLEDIMHLYILYNVEQDKDWVQDIVGEDNTQDVRLARTAYLISRIASLHTPALAETNMRHKNLWKRLEEAIDE